MRRGKALFAATDLQQQCAYALTDLDAHSTSWDANMSDRNNMSDIVRQVASGYAAGVGHEPDADWELRFGHTVGYASTYYSYVYARCVAATVWGRFFEGDALARGAGESLRDGLLRHGGAVEPVEMLRCVGLSRDVLTFPVVRRRSASTALPFQRRRRFTGETRD